MLPKIIGAIVGILAVGGRAANQAKTEKPDSIMVDVIGIGAGVFDRLREQGYPVIAINVAERATDKEQYARVPSAIFNN
jgi:hypothetical protein